MILNSYSGNNSFNIGFVSMLFLIFGKGMSKKIALGFLGFVSMPFLIFEKEMIKKLCQVFWDL